jgi:NAD(P)-dependent dehydrogenase (short-subunit alcohol dehydrogenase family)
MFGTLKQFSLEGKTAVITGGSTGLGLAITRCFTGAGAKVVVLSIEDEVRGQKTLAEFDGKAVFYHFDITDTEHTEKIIDKILDEQGKVDILVNNAGNHCKKSIEEMTINDYEKVLDVHLVGAFSLTKAMVPKMKEQKSGSIIFMASMTSFIGQPYVSGYATAKAGYLGLMHTLCTELGSDNIRVNAIAPGWIDTPMFHKATDNDAERLKKIMGRIPVNCIGDPMDIGMAATFLASDAARYVSGVCIPVDGGALIGF